MDEAHFPLPLLVAAAVPSDVSIWCAGVGRSMVLRREKAGGIEVMKARALRALSKRRAMNQAFCWLMGANISTTFLLA